MKALICALNSKYIHSSLSVWYLLTSCRKFCKENHEIKVYESTVNANADNCLDEISKENPDIVTFSCYIWNKTRVLDICRKLKKQNEKLTVILGGPEVAYNQREILESYSFVDYVLSGEGEIILPKLLDSLSSGASAEGIDGVSFNKDGKLIIKNEAIGESFDYPSPYCEEYFSSLQGRITYIESSRGCPFNCAYCLSGRCGKVRFRSIDQTKKELLLLAKSDTKTVKFIDRTFNCNNDRAVELLRFIRENLKEEIPEDVCFHFEISADILKQSFIDEVSLAPKGLFQFEIGIQSTNPETLKAIGRKSDKEKLFESIRKLTALRNCHIHTDLIAGLPKETFHSFIKGFNESYPLNADMLQLGFLKLLHGSPLREGSANSGFTFSKEPPYEIISTPTLSQEELSLLHKAEKEVDRLHNSGRFRRTLGYALSASGLSPFEFFLYAAKSLEGTLPKKAPLDIYTNALYEALTEFENIDADILRDMMLFDRISTNNSNIVPSSLTVTDKKLKKVKHALSLLDPIKKGCCRTVGILYSQNKVIYSDHIEKDPVSAEYEVKERDFEFFGETFFDFDIDNRTKMRYNH